MISDLPILYEDDLIVVIDKPNDALSVSAADSRSHSHANFNANFVRRYSNITASRVDDDRSNGIGVVIGDDIGGGATGIDEGRKDLSRSDVWMQSVAKLCKSETISPEWRVSLDKLLKTGSILPRKSSSFVKYITRFGGISDPEIALEVWHAIAAIDLNLIKYSHESDGINNNETNSCSDDDARSVVGPPLCCLRSAFDILLAHYRRPIYNVHRLDLETSGILMFAKSSSACAQYSKRFEERSVRKVYAAVVYGRVEPGPGEGGGRRIISAPLSADLERKPRQRVDFSPSGKPSETEVEIVAYCRAIGANTSCTLVYLYPKTGRTHQLRVHMAYINHPIMGDSLYYQDLCKDESSTSTSKTSSADVPDTSEQSSRASLDSSGGSSSSSSSSIVSSAVLLPPRLCLHAHILEFSTGTSEVKIVSPIDCIFTNRFIAGN